MISNKMSKLLNEQLINELYASNLYLSMCSYFQDKNLDGFANFFMIQSDEERAHAMRIFKYLHDVNSKVEMDVIPKPPAKFKSIKDVFEKTYVQEKSNTKDINNLFKQSFSDHDFATHSFMQWFVNEQVEEESLISGIIDQLDMIGTNSSALFLLDRELNSRTSNENVA
ncbi:ferritin [bacterium AH-315-C07]|nr:ferritin [bacterium AH-315-C07]